MRPAVVSRRVSIRWIPDPPSEPTLTLVLTSPAGHYVDIRPLIEGGSIQWAFAGTCTHEIVEGVSTGTWTHEIDSQVDSIYQDSGHFTDLPNGDSLETGRMKDDEGVERDYEEVWHDEDAQPADCYVLKMGDEYGVGYFIRMGVHAQGIIKTKEKKISVIRWDAQGGPWRVVLQSGSQVDWFPAPEALPVLRSGEVYFVGGNGGHAWNVVEHTTQT